MDNLNKNCTPKENGLSRIILINPLDIDKKAFKNGELKLKRKYGKFTRQIIKTDFK